MAGFHGGHPILGIGVPVDAAKGAGPLPFLVGVEGEPLVGLGGGPLPFRTGVEGQALVGAWSGPLPFVTGITRVRSEYTRAAGGGWSPPEKKTLRHILKDDEDLLELIQIIVSSGILE